MVSTWQVYFCNATITYVKCQPRSLVVLERDDRGTQHTLNLQLGTRCGTAGHGVAGKDLAVSTAIKNILGNTYTQPLPLLFFLREIFL